MRFCLPIRPLEASCLEFYTSDLLSLIVAWHSRLSNASSAAIYWILFDSKGLHQLAENPKYHRVRFLAVTGAAEPQNSFEAEREPHRRRQPMLSQWLTRPPQLD